MKAQADAYVTVKSPWVNSVLPFNIALGPVGTLIQLLILNLNGTVLEVGFALTLFNAVSVPSALFWGFVTDRFHKRRPLILASFLVTPILLILFLFANNGYWVSFFYALFSFATTASTTPLNLLVMETEQKPKWASAFARFSMITSVGQTIGITLGMIWSNYFPLVLLVIPLALSSLISAALATRLIKEPLVPFERQLMVMHKSSFFHRIHILPYLFLKLPSSEDFKRVFRNIEHELLRHTALLYLAIFGFFLSAGLFNTSVVPVMHFNGLSGLMIFSVILLGMVVQIISFRFAGRYIERKSPEKSAIISLVLRAVVFSLLGVFTYFITGIWFLLPALIFYPLATGVAYSIYYTASNTMVFNSLNVRRNGSHLGVFSALAGAATMIGSFSSGLVSFYFGFTVTFIISAIFLVISAWLLTLIRSSAPGD